jgi:molybdate transport system regulatory protein
MSERILNAGAGMELKVKVWIEHGERIVFGRGRAILMEAIASTGSISAAARRLGMSYRHAWTMVRASEERLGRPLLVRSKGGRGGGGARLTHLAKALLREYRDIEARLSESARKETRALRKLNGGKEREDDRTNRGN